MKVQITLRKKKDDPMQPSQPPGMSDALKAKVRLYGMDIRYTALEQFRMGFKLDKDGNVQQSNADALAQQQMKFTQGHAELGEKYRIGPRNHRAWIKALALWNHYEQKWGPEHPITKQVGKLMFQFAYDFFARSLHVRHTDINVVQIPPEWYMPQMQGMTAWRSLPYSNMEPPPPDKQPGVIDLNNGSGEPNR